MAAHWFEEALIGDSLARAVRVEVDAFGTLVSVTPESDIEGAEVHKGLAIPALANLHSHAFQRAMAGLAETSDGRPDDFWGWRERMYGFVRRLDQEDIEAIAAQTYVEMLKGGYGSVVEFHYVHRAPEGVWYDDKAATARAIVRGAQAAGIGLVLAPVVYMTAGFDGAPLSERQKRFTCSPEDVAEIRGLIEKDGVRTALALHSLRAAPGAAVQQALALSPQGPIHIHIAEQTAEVEASLAHTGRRPVDYLFDLVSVDQRWCLVHATHMSDEETRRVAHSGAVAGICPSTEGDLGDGFFPMQAFEQAGGVYGVGSDSHVVIDAAEELRWLDYGLRLQTRKRFGQGAIGHRGANLWRAATTGGAAALGQAVGGIVAGARADILVLDPDHPSQIGREGFSRLDALVFSNQGRPFSTVLSGGRTVIREGRHDAEDAIRSRYARTLKKLVA